MGLRYPPSRSPRKRGLWPVTLSLALALGLGACGKVGELRPPPGGQLPVKPKMATTTPTPTELLTPPAIARPARVDEILVRSEPRKPDRFDLPPPSGADSAAEPEAETGAPATTTQTNTQVPR